MTPDKKVEKAPFVPPFVRFVASAIPMVFDDSMSYYECLAALTHYLQHDIVDVINNNATVTEEYIQLTKDLKEYVETYFENLDVQEEINNKLDQMAEDGTLQEIITQYIQANVAWTFNTVADMQSATNLTNGSFAQTLGFNAAGDGGGALYKITNTGTVDNLNTFAVGNLYATAVNNGVKKISLDELELVSGGVYTLGRVKVDSAVELPRQINRNIIIVDTVFDINTEILFPAYAPYSFFVLPSFVGCTFNNLTNGRVLITSGSTDTVGSRFTACYFNNVDMVANTGYIQDFNFTGCYINSYTCFLDAPNTSVQVRMVNCSVESESGQIAKGKRIDGYFSGTYEGNISGDYYLIDCQIPYITLDSVWLEGTKFLNVTGGTAFVDKGIINIHNSHIMGANVSTETLHIDHAEYIEFNTSGTFFSAYNQSSRFCNLTPADFYKFTGSFVYNQGESYVKEFGGSNSYQYAIATVKDVNNLDNKRFYRKEQLIQANTPVDLTFECGTYLLILGRGSYGAINHINEYIISVSKNQTYAYATKMASSGTDSYLDVTTLTPTKANASDTTFTLTISCTLAFAAEIEMIKLY